EVSRATRGAYPVLLNVRKRQESQRSAGSNQSAISNQQSAGSNHSNQRSATGTLRTAGTCWGTPAADRSALAHHERIEPDDLRAVEECTRLKIRAVVVDLDRVGERPSQLFEPLKLLPVFLVESARTRIEAEAQVFTQRVETLHVLRVDGAEPPADRDQ